uniref:L-serine ammonia-lyase n=1 Tax=Laticauda laticaudata TaxID=8630 RepID=A0A8C5WPR5_LATLA
SCSGPFHIETPLLESVALSQTAGTKVYMKLENAQPSGSFKIRGIGYFCQQMAKKGCRHLVCSSGGNAGLAAAYTARELRMPVTIIVPHGTTESTIKRLEQYGANVEIFGKRQHADPALYKANCGICDLHSIVKEMKGSLGTRPGAVVLSVGGGGLLAGVVSGLHEVGWSDVPIIAVETRGAESFNAAIQAGQLVTLPDITRYVLVWG